MELIDKATLKADINKRVTQYRHGDKPMPTIEDIIDEQSTTEVVQCEDCEYASTLVSCQESYLTCTNENGLYRDVPNDGYCYCGVRRNDNNT